MVLARALLKGEFLQEHFIFGANSLWMWIAFDVVHFLKQVKEDTLGKISTQVLITVRGNEII